MCPVADYPTTCALAWLAERSWPDRHFGWWTTWLPNHLLQSQAESWKTASCHHCGGRSLVFRLQPHLEKHFQIKKNKQTRTNKQKNKHTKPWPVGPGYESHICPLKFVSWSKRWLLHTCRDRWTDISLVLLHLKQNWFCYTDTEAYLE